MNPPKSGSNLGPHWQTGKGDYEDDCKEYSGDRARRMPRVPEPWLILQSLDQQSRVAMSSKREHLSDETSITAPPNRHWSAELAPVTFFVSVKQSGCIGSSESWPQIVQPRSAPSHDRPNHVGF